MNTADEIERLDRTAENLADQPTPYRADPMADVVAIPFETQLLNDGLERPLVAFNNSTGQTTEDLSVRCDFGNQLTELTQIELRRLLRRRSAQLEANERALFRTEPLAYEVAPI